MTMKYSSSSDHSEVHKSIWCASTSPFIRYLILYCPIPKWNDFQKIFKRDVAALCYRSPTGNWSVPQYPSFPILGAWRGFLVWEHLGKLLCFLTTSWFWIGVMNFLFCAIFIFIFYIPASSILEAGGDLSVITPRWWTFNFVIWTK